MNFIFISNSCILPRRAHKSKSRAKQFSDSRVLKMVDIVELYKTSFDPVKYAEKYYSVNAEHEMKTLFIDFLHRIFSEGKLPGNSYLDVGSASTIHGVISASKYINEIYLSDLLDSGRAEVEKWLRREPDALDFTWQLKHVAALEGENDHEKISKRIRKAVKGVLPCNVLLANPLDPINTEFDIVASSLCLDVFPDLKDYFTATKNMSSLIRREGHLVLQGSINRACYNVNGIEFPTAKKDAQTSKRALEEAGLKIIEFNEHLYKNEFDLLRDNGGRFTALAIKI